MCPGLGSYALTWHCRRGDVRARSAAGTVFRARGLGSRRVLLAGRGFGPGLDTGFVSTRDCESIALSAGGAERRICSRRSWSLGSLSRRPRSPGSGGGRWRALSSCGAERAEQAGTSSASRYRSFRGARPRPRRRRPRQLFEAEGGRGRCRRTPALLSGAAAAAAPLLDRGRTARPRWSRHPRCCMGSTTYAHTSGPGRPARVRGRRRTRPGRGDAPPARLSQPPARRPALLLLLSAGCRRELPASSSRDLPCAGHAGPLGPLSAKDSAAWLRATAFPDAPEFCAACYDSALGDRQLLRCSPASSRTQPVLHIAATRAT